jgi:MurNAc alpha-1-phosphate uridylyltransferase
MKAMILAAGRGERMRPLTDHTPKPLLQVQGKALIEWHIEALVRGGFAEIVINTAWLGEQLPAQLGDGHRYGASIQYSHEGQALETAGGLAQAMPLLCEGGDDCFWVVAGDVYAPGFEFSQETAQRFATGSELAHLILVPNPPHHPQGDFGLGAAAPLGTWALERPTGADNSYTYSTIGLYRARMLGAISPGQKAPLAPLLRAAMQQQSVSAEVYRGAWTDVGTPERLQQLNEKRMG